MTKWAFAIWIVLFSVAVDAREVTFSWDPLPEAVGYEIQVSDKADFKEVTKSLVLPKSTVDFDLPLGRFFYRVRAIDKDKKAGVWAEPMDLVVTPYPPELVTPKSETSFTYYELPPEIKFDWKPVVGADEFQIFIYKTTGKKALEERVKGETFTTNKLDEGEYMWKVKTIVGIYEGHYGEPRRLIVEKKPFNPPKLISPIRGQSVPAYRPVILVWEKDPVTKYSDITVNVPPEVRGAGFIKTNLETTEHTAEALEPGTYLWSVKSSEGPNSPGLSSEVETFEVRNDIVSAGNTSVEVGMGFVRDDMSSGSLGTTRNFTSPYWNGKYYLSESFGIELGQQSLALARAPSVFQAMRTQASLCLRVGRDGFQQDILFGYRVTDEPVSVSADSANIFSFSGPMVGVDMRGPLSKKMRFLLRFTYFKPIENSQKYFDSLSMDTYDGSIGFGYNLTDQLWLNYRYIYERTVSRNPVSGTTVEWESTRSTPFSFGLRWDY